MTPDDVERALERAAAAEDRESLWDALTPLRPLLDRDETVARLWAEALRTSPTRSTLVEEAEAILETWPGHPGLVGLACGALLRSAERAPIDEPPPADTPASLAAAAVSRCLGKLDERAANDPAIGARLHALRGNALALLGPKRVADAVEALSRAIALDPEEARFEADLAIVYKRARRFDAMLVAAKAAAARLPGERGVLWNLAIAATACGEAATALEAWRGLGVEATCREGSLPFVEGMKPIQVRLPTLGPGHELSRIVPDEAASFELVWAQPLSPCHGVVRSPTLRDAVADFGDTILWDGVPVMVSEIDGETVPRMPLLGVLKKGDERRFPFLALQQQPGQVQTIGRALTNGALLVPQGERVEVVCPRCAAGDTMRKHEHLPAEEHRVAFGKLVVPADVDLAGFAAELEAARKRQPGVLMAIPDLYEALEDTKQAGQHHKRWGTIERTATPGAEG